MKVYRGSTMTLCKNERIFNFFFKELKLHRKKVHLKKLNSRKTLLHHVRWKRAKHNKISHTVNRLIFATCECCLDVATRKNVAIKFRLTLQYWNSTRVQSCGKLTPCQAVTVPGRSIENLLQISVYYRRENMTRVIYQ